VRRPADHFVEEANCVSGHIRIGQRPLHVGGVAVPSALRREHAESLGECGSLRLPCLVRAQPAVEKDEWLTSSIIVVPRVKTADIDVFAHRSPILDAFGHP
jgi:hypothetical protein